MKRKHILTWATLTFIIIAALISLELNVYFEEHSFLTKNPATIPNPIISSFADCLLHGLPVTEGIPRTCTTTEGVQYSEELKAAITYIHATQDLIVPSLPAPGATVGKEFTVTGKARGTWYFEASFPIKLLDKDGNVLVTIPAKATSDWMTSEFVPFVATMTVPMLYKGKATIVLQKDNPSGMPENDASISFPVSINY